MAEEENRKVCKNCRWYDRELLELNNTMLHVCFRENEVVGTDPDGVCKHWEEARTIKNNVRLYPLDIYIQASGINSDDLTDKEENENG